MEKLKRFAYGYGTNLPQHCGSVILKEGNSLDYWIESRCRTNPVLEYCGHLISFII